MNLDQLMRKVDRFNDTREARLEADKTAKSLKEIENQLQQEIIEAMVEHNVTSVQNVKLQKKEKFVAKDWPEIYAYISDNQAFELLERRLHQSAIAERREHGENLPGVGIFVDHKLSISKRA